MKILSKMMKVMLISVIAVMLITAMPNLAFADPEGGGAAGGSDYASLINEFKNPEGNGDLNESATSIVGAIISVTRIIAVGVAIIMLTAVAIKYMSSAPGDRAEIKKHAVIYVVGAVVLFGASGILGIIQKFGDSI